MNKERFKQALNDKKAIHCGMQEEQERIFDYIGLVPRYDGEDLYFFKSSCWGI